MAFDEHQGEIGARLFVAGAPAGDPFLLYSGSGYQGSVALTSHKGTEFFVAFEDHALSPYAIRGVRVTSSGGVVAPSGVVLARASSHLFGPAVASNGSTIVVAYDESGSQRVRLAEVDDGDVVSPDGGVALTARSSEQHGAVLAWGSDRGLVLWDDKLDGFHAVYERAVSPALVSEGDEGRPLALGVNPQLETAAASNGDTTLIVWEDWRDGQSNIVGARVSRSGEPVDPQGLVITDEPRNQLEPSVAWLGESWLVVWRDENRPESTVLARRVSRDGQLLEAGPLTLVRQPGGQWSPAVAATADTALVVFNASSSQYDSIVGVRVASSGAVVDAAPIVLADGPLHHRHPVVAAAGSGFVVGWVSETGIYEHRFRTRGVSAAGQVSGPDGGAELFPYSHGDPHPGAIACGATDCLAAWAFGWTTARSTTHEGVPSGQWFWLADDDGELATVGASGGAYQVAWHSDRSSVTRSVHGARVLADGTALELAPMRLTSTDEVNATSPALAPVADGTLLLAYSAFDARPSVVNPRARARFLLTLDGTDGGAADGGLGGGGTEPGIASEPSVFLECGEALRYAASPGSAPTTAGPGLVAWALEAGEAGATLPAGLAIDGSTGVLSWIPGLNDVGTYHVRLVARGSGWVDRQALTLEVACAPRSLRVGLGCAAVGASLPTGTAALAGLAALGLAAAFFARRRAARPPLPGRRPSSGRRAQR